jgi:myo-inositol-1(or 4)-monophosphatase
MAHEPSELIALMIAAAREAGDELERDFAALGTLEIQHKGPADFFSAADLKAEETVKRRLTAACPDYGFLGEEGGLTNGDARYVWMVDPLDGTTNFLRGLPLWAVNIALAENGRPIAGVTYVPPMKEMFWAERDRGAWLNGQPIRVADTSTLEASVLAVGIPFAGKPRQQQFVVEMERLTPRVTGVRRLGAGAVDMAYVACGRFDAYWEQSVSPWDMAAGAIIIEEAGGLALNTLGEPLDVMAGTVLACTPGIRDELVAALAPV